MNAPAESPVDLGARRAREYLHLLEAGRTEDAGALVEALTETRDLVFVGAGFTALARGLRSTLPPAARAQANSRQMLLGQLRDANRSDVGGLRTWVRRAGEEVATVARLAEPEPVARRQLLGLPSAG
ncbi:MAG: uncharacterized protein JWR70_1124 [Modestobacter sp.]|nr:uncharacterized protein [Modestobacter sp.]